MKKQTKTDRTERIVISLTPDELRALVLAALKAIAGKVSRGEI